MEPKVIGMAAALGSAASWAIGSILFKTLGEHMAPGPLTLAKGTVASVFLLIGLVFIGSTPIAPEHLWLLVLSGVIGIGLADPLFFMALNRLPAHAVVILFTLGQVLTVLLAVALLGERPSPTEWVGMGLVVLGVTAVLWVQLSDEGTSVSWVGILCGLTSVVAMSSSFLIVKEPLETVGSWQATLVRMVAGSVVMLVFLQSRGEIRGAFTSLMKPKVVVSFLGSVAVITIGGFWLSMHAIANVEVAIANTLNSTEPLFVLPLAAFILKEKITLPVVLSSLIAVSGIALIAGII